MPLILSGNVASALGGEYEVANSCRFNDDDSARLAITPSGDGSAEKWTFSFWIKMYEITTDQRTIRMYEKFLNSATVIGNGEKLTVYFRADENKVGHYQVFSQFIWDIGEQKECCANCEGEEE